MNWKSMMLGIICLWTMGACSGKVNADWFEETLWKNDKNGCKNDRLELLDQILRLKDQLIGLDDKELRKVLGKPDRIDLMKRNQKFYVYFVEAGKQCAEGQNKEAKKVLVRFSSLNLVNEISIDYSIKEE
ncbi:hypothetical protein AAG747_14945 [Rapidithrix thailandica]|uniref:Lipoprotein n=1 Tax=Rapidithrix thailandica TaxID=413964 RepID=A0AAW9S8D0_9BACT